MKVRRLVWGLVVTGAYLATAIALAGDGPVLPMYEIVPIDVPYRWVNPPPEFEQSNVPPEPIRQEVALTETGSVSASIVTNDGQAALVVRDGSFTPRLGEIAVIVEIVPVDPTSVGEPPEGVRYDGNAYRMSATYAKEKAPAPLANQATVVLKSPLGGTRLLRHDGAAAWVEISAQPVAASLQVFGETTALGTFVAGQTVHTKPFPWLPISIGATGVAVGAGWFAATRSRKRKPPPPRRDRRAAAKGGTGARRPPPPRRKKR